MFEEAWRTISAYDTIIIHRHSKPDGDAIGSQVGLKHLILENLPGKQVLTVGDNPGRYGFVEDSTPDGAEDGDYAGALAVILDSASAHLVSDDRFRLADRRLRIDHHIFCENFAELEIVDTSFESCCGEIALMAEELGLKVSPTAAAALFTGMVTDSGRFRYDATTPRTFRLASFLMQTPFSTERIYRSLYADSLERLQLRARFIMEIRVTEKKVAYVYTTAEKMKEYGVDTFTVSRGMVNCMGDIKDVDIWVNFTESKEGVLCELRSSSRNIQQIAVKYGGGGHAKASGAVVKDREEAMRMLQDLEQLMEKEN